MSIIIYGSNNFPLVSFFKHLFFSNTSKRITFINLEWLANIQLYDWFGGILTLAVLLIVWVSCKQTGSMRANTKDDTLDYYIRIKNRYQKNSVLFYGAYCWLTLYSIYATIVVLYISVYQQEDSLHKVFLYSVVSLFCTVINFVINFRDIAATYRECFIMYEREILIARDGHDHDPEWSKKKDRYNGLYEADHNTEIKLGQVIK